MLGDETFTPELALRNVFTRACSSVGIFAANASSPPALPSDGYARIGKAMAHAGGTMARSSIKRSGKTSKAKAKKSGRAAAPSSGAGAKRADWTNLKVAWPQPKQAISLRIDQDILDWFRGGGSGYQTRMNAVLRALVDAQQGRR
jgi:uncharacterized protein (DUF4415 family)